MAGARGRARRARARVLLAREEDDRGGVEMGWAAQELGRLGWTGKRQVSCWASLLFFIFLFCFLLFNSFATVLNLK